MPLPPSFTSLYRLFLRTAAASVLHQPRATRALRKLWRPTFEEGARVTNLNRPELEGWLSAWHRRVDNALGLLHASAQTHGIPHQVTRNLALLLRAEQKRVDSQRYVEWRPQLPRDSKEYELGGKETKEAKRRKEEEGAMEAVWEAVRMAEGRGEITLGQIGRRG